MQSRKPFRKKKEHSPDQDQHQNKGKSRRNTGKSKSGPGNHRRGKKDGSHGDEPREVTRKPQPDAETRLNKYIASAGICSRREADTLIAEGKVKVNGKVVTELGIKVKPKDKVIVNGHPVNPEEYVYILLNKPKNTISTTDDEKDRRTVLDIVEKATGKRVYPVGRLDRNTTGLILLTNDGELTHRLMHPGYKVRKIYQVETDVILSDDQLTMLRQGVQLDDGPARAYRVDRHSVLANVIRMSIIEGRNHQVKRMISAVGAEVTSLKRVVYAGLEIGDLRQGRWRYLTQREVRELRRLVKLLDKKSLNL